MSRPITYPRSKLLALCADLGHDPAKVSQIVIDHAYVHVEFVHPITEDTPLNEAIPITEEVSDE